MNSIIKTLNTITLSIVSIIILILSAFFPDNKKEKITNEKDNNSRI
jgi:hypothetical protein